ncbi:MAG: DUF2339 domain-containing protein [Geminicoccaceae bacterium]|nr:DUF2339 domain-containing protein [Geminicoccaceae bacterium]
MNLLLLIVVVIAGIVLACRLARLERRLDRLEAAAGTVADEAAAEAASDEAAPATRGPWGVARAPDASARAEADHPLDDGEAFASPPAAPPGEAARGGLEERLTQRWLVWLGGGVFALGGVLLVQLAADRGFFGPGMRLLMGAAIGITMVVAGEWLRRRDRAAVAAGRDYVPPALTAAGLATLFAAIWAGYALYAFLPPLPAFAALAVLSILAMLLALLHGLFLALLGLLGGLVVPLLIDTGAPSAAGLFAYLAIVVGAAFGVLHWMPWRTLFWCLVPAVALWPIVAALPGGPEDAERASGWFLLFCTALATLLPLAGERFAATLRRWSPPRTALGLVAVLLWPLVVASGGFSGTGMALLAAGVATALAATRLRRHAGPAMLVVTGAVVLVLLIYDLGPLRWFALDHPVPAVGSWNFEDAVLRPTDADAFVFWCAVFALLLGVAGALFVPGAASPGLFATVSVFGPLAVLALAYLRLADLTTAEPLWASMAGALGLVAVAATALAMRWGPAYRGAAWAFAAGVTAALALGAGMVLEQGWLAVALMAEAAALVALWRRLRLRTLLLATPWLTAAALALIVLAPETMGLARGEVRGVLDTVRALVLPALLASAAASLLRRRHPATDRFRRIFEGAALGLWVLAVACLARDLAAAVGGGALAEAGIRVTAWLATAYAILRARGTRGMAGAAFTLLLVLVVVVGGFDLLVVSMPLATGDPVGAWPILNALLPAYGLPALLFALMAGHRRAIAWQRRAAGAAALLLALLWGFFEVRRAFLGPVLIGPMSQSELYAHSLLLLTAAVLLLAAGLLRASLDLRRAGLALLAAAILKVFLVDLGNLEGVLRAASFMGLGLCLIGAGWAFRRWGRAPAGRSA